MGSANLVSSWISVSLFDSSLFLGGLSLHLNHLIAWHMGISFSQFVTLPIGIFRWFKFTLKPPYTVAHGNFLSAIWGTSHWTSFVKFGLKTAWDISYDILWPILKYVNFWRLQGRSSNLSKKDAFRKSIFSRWRSDEALTRLGGVLGGQVPRLYIWWYHFGGVQHTWGIRRGI